MLKARWAARENAPDTEVPATTRCSPSPRARAASARARSPSTWPPPSPPWATRSACSTPTSGASRCPACSASRAGWPARRPADGRSRSCPTRRRSAPGLLKVVSTGLLVDDEGTALMWRGLMLTKARRAVPPRRALGRRSTTCSSTCRRAPATCRWAWPACCPAPTSSSSPHPPWRAQKVAIRAADMARRSFLRVAGVIENMSAFTCDHGETYALFGEGGGAGARRRDRRRAARPGADRGGGGRGRRRRRPVALDGDGRGRRRVPGHRRHDRHRDRAPGRDGRLQRPAARGGRARPRPESRAEPARPDRARPAGHLGQRRRSRTLASARSTRPS